MNSPTAAQEEVEPISQQANLWALMFAAYGFHNATLLSGFWWGRMPPADLTQLFAWLTVLLSAATLIRPDLRPLRTSFVVAWFGLLACRFPNMVNHEVVTFAMCGAYLASAVWPGRTGNPAGREHPERTFARFIPAGRAVLLVMYFYVVFHKINHGYFTSPTSCAWVMYLDVAAWVKVLPTWDALSPLLIYGVLLTEAGLPILLAIPRTRVIGAVSGTLFHGSLALHTNVFVEDFSLLVMSSYVLFLPPDLISRGLSRMRAALRARGIHAPPSRLRALALGLGLLLAAIVILLVGDGVKVGSRNIEAAQFTNRPFYWLVVALYLLMFWLGRIAPHPPKPAWGKLLHPNLVVPALLFTYGLFPYFGLSTSNVLAMFSNVSFERESNHLLLGDQLRMFDYAGDWATLVDSSNPRWLKKHPPGQRTYPMAYWRGLFRQAEPELVVTFETAEGQRTYRASTRPPEPPFVPLSRLERLMGFRWIPEPGKPVHCQH